MLLIEKLDIVQRILVGTMNQNGKSVNWLKTIPLVILQDWGVVLVRSIKCTIETVFVAAFSSEIDEKLIQLYVGAPRRRFIQLFCASKPRINRNVVFVVKIFWNPKSDNFYTRRYDPKNLLVYVEHRFCWLHVESETNSMFRDNLAKWKAIPHAPVSENALRKPSKLGMFSKFL